MSDEKPMEPVPVSAEMSVDEFCRDESAVLAWREFLNSPTGIKLQRVMVGLDPINKLATAEMHTPGLIRAAARAEGESAEVLLGKSTGFAILRNTLVQRLPKLLKGVTQPSSRRAGKREIPNHPASVP
jgi:hypothetical protein